VAAGEQIYAVQYRKVRFRWFSSRDLERAALEKGKQWKVHGSLRGQEVGTNDVLEAAISEDEDSDREETMSSPVIIAMLLGCCDGNGAPHAQARM
jgi:hypothetical protein